MNSTLALERCPTDDDVDACGILKPQNQTIYEAVVGRSMMFRDSFGLTAIKLSKQPKGSTAQLKQRQRPDGGMTNIFDLVCDKPGAYELTIELGTANGKLHFCALPEPLFTTNGPLATMKAGFTRILMSTNDIRGIVRSAINCASPATLAKLEKTELDESNEWGLRLLCGGAETFARSEW